MHVCRVHGSVCTWYIPLYGVYGVPLGTGGGDGVHGHTGVVPGGAMPQDTGIQGVHGGTLIRGYMGYPWV